MLTIKQVSEYLQIKASTLYSWTAQGKIPSVKIHGLIRFRQEEIDRWVESFRKDLVNTASLRPRGKRRHDIHAIVDRVLRDVHNTNRGRPDQDKAKKEDSDGNL